MKRLKAIIAVLPVAWSEEKVLKYQAHSEFSSVKIYGDPKATEEAALNSLRKASEDYIRAAQETIAALSK
jgi:hypothetical protein